MNGRNYNKFKMDTVVGNTARPESFVKPRRAPAKGVDMFCRRIRHLDKRGEDLAFPTDIHFPFPVFLGLALADGAINEPA